MIVVTPRITRDFAGGRVVLMRMRGVVIQSHSDNRFRFGKNLSRIGALLRVASHPGHFSVKAPAQPFFQALAFGLQTFSRDDADFIETNTERALLNLRRHRGAKVTAGNVGLLVHVRFKSSIGRYRTPTRRDSKRVKECREVSTFSVTRRKKLGAPRKDAPVLIRPLGLV